MKSHEFMGTLSKMLGAFAAPVDNTMNVGNPADLSVVTPDLVDQSDTETMVPPLQQKIELLKKAVDVDSFYDDESESKDSTQAVNITLNVPPGQSDSKIDLTVNNQSIDEVDQIKQLAGVPVAAIFDAGDDEPLDS